MQQQAAKRVLVLGAAGSMGHLLLPGLIAKYGRDHVVAGDLLRARPPTLPAELQYGQLNVKIFTQLDDFAKQQNVGTIISLLSPTTDKNTMTRIKLVRNPIDFCYKNRVKLFFASNFEVYGSSPNPIAENTKLEPSSIEGVFKQHGELTGLHALKWRGMQFRALRFPVIVTPHAADMRCRFAFVSRMFSAATKDETFKCPISLDKRLPLIHVSDCTQLLSREEVTQPIYNLPGVSASPRELLAEIHKFRPKFDCTFAPDPDMDSLPSELSDKANAEWGWKGRETVASLVERMFIPNSAEML